ncbi:AraC family transcriptional regulator [Kushneria aurantia]|uniref:Helix-turn-helix domain-containing protein n=1 Tax=Kushneria aurantia TaxID=504092 RepID=A0ABV6FZL8_9GAMM|nr:AraC family transcriptional regulator [Kushneria aurantia]
MKTISLPRGRHRLHVMPTSAGCERRDDSGYYWDGLKRGRLPFTVLQYSLAGTGYLNFEHRDYSLPAGTLMIVDIPGNHRYWAEAGQPWHFFWLATAGQEALRLQRMLQRAVGPAYRPAQGTVDALAGCCLSLLEGEARASGHASALVYHALMVLYDDVMGANGRDREGLDDKLQQVLDYIREHLDRPISVEALASLAGMSRAHFTRYFTTCRGQPPGEFIMHKRMRRASRLLAEQESSVREIARQCGFADANYFAKAFKRYFGITPTEFRTTGMYLSTTAN